jgi:feruloyl-CoA synthase
MAGAMRVGPTGVVQEFWNPRFEYERREDGTILMRQTDPLEPYLTVLADYLDKWADEAPNQIWLARRNKEGDWLRITYREARAKARALGAGLLQLGLGPDRPLLILSENSLEHGLLSLACLYVGIPYAPVSPAYSLVSKDHAKLKAVAKLLRPGAVFADDGAAFAPALASIEAARGPIINHRNRLNGALDFADLLKTETKDADQARTRVTPETVVKYLFTSGSTGSPKAVINTNAMITANQAMVRDCYRFLNEEPPIVLDWAPWNHTAAGNKVSYMVLTNGGSYYIDDGKPSADGMVETVRNLREIPCTWYFNVPAGWDRLVGELESDDALAQTFFSRLRMMFYAGAGMAQHTWDRLRKVACKTTGRDVLIGSSLGATETSPFALAWTRAETQAGNIGVPSRGLTMKLAPVGDKLELRLKGPSITPGYLGDPEKSAEAFDEEGFYCMGDALRPVDPDDLSLGFLFDGRTAENFKLSTGTWVAVGVVRAALVDAMDGLIRDAVIVGENASELGALLWLSEAGQGMTGEALNETLTEKLKAHGSAATGSASRVRRVAVLNHEPSFDKGELTEKGSLNQRALRNHNAHAIEQLYGDGPCTLRV